MALETGEYIGNLVATNPTPSDPKSQGDDHLRLIKSTLQNSFAGIEGMILVSGVESGAGNAYTVALSGEPTTPAAYTANMVVLFQATHANTGNCTLSVAGIAAAPLLDANGNQLPANAILVNSIIVATYIGTNFYLVSPAGMASLTSPAFVGTPTAPTPALTDNSTKIATTAFAVQLAFQAALPAQTGNAGKFLSTNGTAASWNYPGPITLNPTVTASSVLSVGGLMIPVVMSAANQTITLPSAIGMPLGAQYLIDNTVYSKQFTILDSTGILLAVIPSGATVSIFLENNSTSAGLWEFNNQSRFGEILQSGSTGTATVLSTDQVDTYIGIASMGSGKYFVTWDDNTNLYGAVITVTGASIAIGAIASMAVPYVGIDFINASYSAQNGVITYFAASTGAENYLGIIPFSISGTTVTFGATLVITTAGTANQLDNSAVMLTSTAGIYWQTTGTAGAGLTAFTTNGSAVTMGTTLAALSTLPSVFSPLSSTTALYATCTGAWVLQLSSGTVSSLSSVTFSNIASISIVQLSASTYLAVGILGAVVLTLSGNTVSAGQFNTITLPGGVGVIPDYNNSLVALSSTEVIFALQTSTNAAYLRLLINGNQVLQDILYISPIAPLDIPLYTNATNTILALSNSGNLTATPITLIK